MYSMLTNLFRMLWLVREMIDSMDTFQSSGVGAKGPRGPIGRVISSYVVFIHH